jgi:starch phosphorylase
VDLISSGFFSRGDRYLFKPLVDSLLEDDPYLLLADYRPYVESQDQVSHAYKDQAKWTRMSILNVARMGKFSSDRSIKDYCSKIWNAQPTKVKLGKYVIDYESQDESGNRIIER